MSAIDMHERVRLTVCCNRCRDVGSGWRAYDTDDLSWRLPPDSSKRVISETDTTWGRFGAGGCSNDDEDDDVKWDDDNEWWCEDKVEVLGSLLWSWSACCLASLTTSSDDVIFTDDCVWLETSSRLCLIVRLDLCSWWWWWWDLKTLCSVTSCTVPASM